jgi:hypothetical protein
MTNIESAAAPVTITPLAAAAKVHTERLAAGAAEKLADAHKLYFGQRELTIVRAAVPSDDGFSASLPMSIVTWPATGKSHILRDDLITNHPTGF